LNRQIPRVTIPDKARMAWLIPLALVLATWWLFRVNPCLDNEAGNRMREWFPSPPQENAQAPAVPDAVVIENPYGVEACDYWPTVTDHWITLLTLLFITALVGILAARFEHRPVRRAALVMLVGMMPAVAFSNLVYLPAVVKYAEYDGYGPALLEIGVGVAVVLLAAALAAFSAWLRLKFRAHG
jgi:hypothetical protein